MTSSYFVYILASRRNGTLYVGVTNDLVRRISEHKSKVVPGFTRKYSVDKLVYFERIRINSRSACAGACLEALGSRLEACAHRGDKSSVA